MITVQNRRLFENLPFEEYLQLPGTSHSDIKSNGTKITVTKKMLLGTRVHNYLLTPDAYDYDDIGIVRPVAMKLKEKLGPLLQYAKPEVSGNAYFVYGQWRLLVRFRCDLLITPQLQVDIKVSDVPLAVSIPKFGYDDQQNGYQIGFGVKRSLIVRISPKTKDIETYMVPFSEQFWKMSIMEKGEPI